MKKTRIGQVISNKMQKTVIVSVQTTKLHPLYKKAIKKITNYKVHDEESACKEGDTVRIVETRPLSREKHWRVEEILTKKEAVAIQPDKVA